MTDFGVRIERASTNDLVMLATDRDGGIPTCMGAILLISAGPKFEIEAIRALIAERVRAVPRLRQRLARVPLGCGRPIFLDDPSFSAGSHIESRTCPSPGDHTSLHRLAVAICAQPLPPNKPLWRAVLVTGLTGGQVALILVLHHVLADGIGGIAVLETLLDQGARTEANRTPQPRPSYRTLAAQAARSRILAVSRLPMTVRAFPNSVAAIGGLHSPVATACSLLQRTGPHRQIATAEVSLAALRSAAHGDGATINDALLVAVTGALEELLHSRGEHVGQFRVTVPIASRRLATAHRLGNDNAPMVVQLPGSGGTRQRLQQVSMIVRTARAATGAPSPAALFGPLFRVLATGGAYRAFLRHQRRFHTIVSNLRGPDGKRTLAGSPVESITAISLAEMGNVTISFVALSYAGSMIVTIIADADFTPDLPTLAAALQGQLDAISNLEQSAHPVGPPAGKATTASRPPDDHGGLSSLSG